MALKIEYKICCGIDVHKTFVVVCIANTNSSGITTYKSHRSSTKAKGLKELLKCLLDCNCEAVCMESTGKYWIPVHNVLERGFSIVLVHPKYLKAIRGKKTDKKDAKWNADLFKHDLVAGSFMPPVDNRKLRDLMRYRYILTCYMPIQNCLTVSNIQLGNVVSYTFGKSLKRILDKILENPFILLLILNLNPYLLLLTLSENLLFILLSIVKSFFIVSLNMIFLHLIGPN